MSAKKHILTVLGVLFVIHMILAFVSSMDKRPMPVIGEVERWDLKKIFGIKTEQSAESSETKNQAAAVEAQVESEDSEEEGEPYNFWVLNKVSFTIAWLIIIFHIFVARKVSKNLQMIPGRLQAFYELIVEMWDGICASTLGTKQKGRLYLPLILTLFIYLFTCNWIGIIPSVWQIVDKEVLYSTEKINGEEIKKEIDIKKHGEIKNNWKAYNADPKTKNLIFSKYLTDIYNKENNTNLSVSYEPFIPSFLVFEEPSQDLNTTLGLGLLVFFTVVFSAYFKHGILGILKELSAPFIIMLPLNIIGEIGKLISHSFRIFGNIKGGAIIFLVITYLTSNVLLPVPMYAYFGMFAGTVQALVFAMLAVVFIAMWVGGEEEEHQPEAEHKN
ncbi:MAG TPA: F0F1 ATP synthase subunit A [bacterium]|nr:F0F1 ATP synthase subunit A [bacterium]